MLRLLAGCLTVASTVALALPASAVVLMPDPTQPLQTIVTGQRFTEGPTYYEDANGKYLVFTDTDNSTFTNDRIKRYNLGTGTVDMDLASPGGANGTILDGNGNLLTADQIAKQISRRPLTDLGTPQEVAKGYTPTGGVLTNFNGPNDVVPDSNGGLYFTDPTFRASTLPNAFYYVDSNGVSTQYQAPQFPNGIILSPDEQTLYVNNWANNGGSIRKYNVTAPGQVDVAGVTTFITLPGMGNGGFDGMTVDPYGNLYAAFRTPGQIGTVRAWDPTGQEIFTLLLGAGGGATNVELGGSDGMTLFITRGANVYSQAMVRVPPIPEPAVLTLLAVAAPLLALRRRRG